MVAWNQYVVLFGGRSDSRVCNLIYVFNTINFTWKKYNNTYFDMADLQNEEATDPEVNLVSGQVLRLGIPSFPRIKTILRSP